MAGRGSILKRTTKDGRVRYLARVWTAGRKSVAKTFSTHRLAQAWLHDKSREIETRGLIRVSNERLAVYLREWASVWTSHLRPHVRIEYQEMLDRYVIPALGEIQLSRLRPADFQRLYNEMTAGGRRHRSAQYVHAVLKLAFDRAVAEGKLMVSPLATVPRPKAPHRRERIVLSEADAGRFLGALDSHRYRALWTLELLHAMRPGEALALHWGDIDLDAGVVHIRHTMTDSGERLAPKTASGVRSIMLSRAARAALAAHALAAGARSPDSLVFTTSTRRHEHPRNVRRSFKALCEKLAYGEAYAKKAEALGVDVGELTEPQRVEARASADAQPGFTTMTMYELRHSCASILLSRGESIAAVSQMLGHKSAKTTLQFYARALPKDSERLADAMDGMIDARIAGR